jgi:glutamyl endopeptidase
MELAQAMRNVDGQEVTNAPPSSAGGSGDSDTVTIRSAQILGGSDDRVNLNAVASLQPYVKTAGMYYSPISQSNAWCTCFKLINEHTCITAAHCLYNPGVGWFPGFNIRFGLGGPSAKPELGLCWKESVPGEWASSGDDSYDYGVIILHGRFGANCNTPDYSVGWHSWTEPPHSNGIPLPQYAYFSATTYGYPQFPKSPSPYPTLSYSTANNNYTFSGNWYIYLFHYMDTTGGQSGSPVFNSSGAVIGIHKGFPDTSVNYASSLTSSRVSYFQSVAGF